MTKCAGVSGEGVFALLVAAEGVEELAGKETVAAVDVGRWRALVIIGFRVWEVGEAKGRVLGFAPLNTTTTTARARLNDGFPSSQAIPFHMLVFANRFHLVAHALFVDAFCFGDLILLTGL